MGAGAAATGSAQFEESYPSPAPQPDSDANAGINCPKCGKPNDSWDTRCFWCGTMLKGNQKIS